MKYITGKFKKSSRRLKRTELKLILMSYKVKSRKSAITEPKDQNEKYERKVKRHRGLILKSQ